MGAVLGLANRLRDALFAAFAAYSASPNRYANAGIVSGASKYIENEKTSFLGKSKS